MSGAYAVGALAWFEAGWWPLPLLRRNGKGEVPAGWTGYRGDRPSQRQVEDWMEAYPNAGLCLRLPRDVVGLDGDDYESDAHPAGAAAATLAGLEKLPATYRVGTHDWATTRSPGSGCTGCRRPMPSSPSSGCGCPSRGVKPAGST